MKTGSNFFRRTAWTLGATLLFAAQAAQACPGCKQVMVDGKTALNGVSIGFSLGVLFMLGTVFAVLGGLGYMMYRSCQAIAAQQQAEMARQDAAFPLSSAQPA